MPNRTLTLHQLIRCFVTTVFILSAQIGFADETNKSNKDLIPIVVFDIELLGDTSVDSMKQEDAVLINKFSNELRRLLKEQNIVDVIDDDLSLLVINQAAQNQFLHRCNGCELHIAKKLGATQVVIPWVFRMSKLVQTMYVEVRDVKTGRVLMRKGLDFRGNTDNGWTHVTNRLVQEIGSYVYGR